MASRFSDSVYVVLMGLRGFAIGILGSLPILVVWGVILAVVVILLRKFVFKKSKKNKKEHRPDERKPAISIDITGFRVIEARKLFFLLPTAPPDAIIHIIGLNIDYRKKEDKRGHCTWMLDREKPERLVSRGFKGI